MNTEGSNVEVKANVVSVFMTISGEELLAERNRAKRRRDFQMMQGSMRQDAHD